jgi:hypothetical protein
MLVTSMGYSPGAVASDPNQNILHCGLSYCKKRFTCLLRVSTSNGTTYMKSDYSVHIFSSKILRTNILEVSCILRRNGLKRLMMKLYIS